MMVCARFMLVRGGDATSMLTHSSWRTALKIYRAAGNDFLNDCHASLKVEMHHKVLRMASKQ